MQLLARPSLGSMQVAQVGRRLCTFGVPAWILPLTLAARLRKDSRVPAE